jgi:hypothetical protein
MDTNTPFQPTLADSASGKLNAQTLHCTGHSRSMSYAACLARLKANENKEPDLPADWSECAQHRRSGNCNASKMRDEELTACKPLYFVKRGAVETFMALAHKVASGWKKGELPLIAARPAAGKSSYLDHIAKTDYAAAITAAAIQKPIQAATTPPVMAVAKPIQPAIQALPGESPLQMARRIAAQRAASQPVT